MLTSCRHYHSFLLYNDAGGCKGSILGSYPSGIRSIRIPATTLLGILKWKRWKIILVITKNEAKKLADKGLQFHKDLFTGKWKRRRYYLREDLEGRNIKLLNEIRGNIAK